MNMYENWNLTRWETSLSDAPSLRMEYLLDRDAQDGALELVLQSVSTTERIRCQITFVRYPAYRNILEEFRLELWARRDTISTAYALGCTMIVPNSPWIRELGKEPLLMIRNKNLVHYMVVTEDDVIEILTDETPIIEVLGPVESDAPIPGKSEIFYK